MQAVTDLHKQVLVDRDLTRLTCVNQVMAGTEVPVIT